MNDISCKNLLTKECKKSPAIALSHHVKIKEN